MSTDRRDRGSEGDLTPGDDPHDTEIAWVEDEELAAELDKQARDS